MPPICGKALYSSKCVAVSEDGLYFFKSPEIIARFKASPAYNILIIELLSDATKAAAFINGIFPESISEKIYQK